MNRLHQGRYMLWGGELANAMAQVENVGWPRGGFVGVRFAKTVQHPNHFLLNLRWGCKQDIGIDVALQSFARAIHGATHHLAGSAQVHGPVKAQNFAVQ